MEVNNKFNNFSLYYEAKTVREEADESKKRGINLDSVDYDNIKSLENKLLLTSILSHLISGGAVYAVAEITKEEIVQKRTSYLFFGSILFRPLYAFHSYLRKRLNQILFNVTYPRGT
jgi:hypothetical protein